MKYCFFALSLAVTMSVSLSAQTLYFPPLTGSTWQTVTPQSLGWCQDRLDTLVNFVESTHGKGFIILKGGKIVVEEYFGTFTQDSLWYWASAAKSLVGFMTGMANEDGYFDLDEPTSEYLGTGWSSLSPEKEALVTIRNQITMTTGLNDAVADPDCISPSCLTYLADAGTRWAYHNAPYLLMHDVIANASGQTFQQFTNQQVKSQIGMSTGTWVGQLFFSKTRDMARFGLLNLAEGNWNGNQLLADANYLYDMKHTSNDYNLSYGYLWWLNGQSSFMLPQTQFVFNTSLVSTAPADMYAALGKNDQKIYVVPSLDMVVVRMGNAANESVFAVTSFDTQLWQRISALECGTSDTEQPTSGLANLSPNPTNGLVNITLNTQAADADITFLNTSGQVCLHTKSLENDISALPSGIYFVKIIANNRTETLRLVKN